jgi:hypothetical protein
MPAFGARRTFATPLRMSALIPRTDMLPNNGSRAPTLMKTCPIAALKLCKVNLGELNYSCSAYAATFVTIGTDLFNEGRSPRKVIS